MPWANADDIKVEMQNRIETKPSRMEANITCTSPFSLLQSCTESVEHGWNASAVLSCDQFLQTFTRRTFKLQVGDAFANYSLMAMTKTEETFHLFVKYF